MDTKNELTNATPAGSMTYDSNGNLLTANGGKTTYAYDDENRLTSWDRYSLGPSNPQNGDVATDFAYDGLNRLRERLEYIWVQPGSAPSGTNWVLTNAVLYIYDGNRVIQERDTNSTPTVSYTRGTDLSGSLEGAGGIGGLLARSSGYSAGNWSTHNFYHADGNGNITYLESSSQTLAASYRYDPFGNTLSSSGSYAAANVYRFSSKECHTNSGMYYYLYRFYDPNLQRWINRDPLGEPGFEATRLVTKPLSVRRFGLSPSWGAQFLLANAVRNGSIRLERLTPTPLARARGSGRSLSVLAALWSDPGAVTLSWPAEVLENENLFDFAGNNPLDDFDTWGDTWYLPWTWQWPKQAFNAVVVAVRTVVGDPVSTGADAVECAQGIYEMYPGITNRNAGFYGTGTGSDGDYEPPVTLGGAPR